MRLLGWVKETELAMEEEREWGKGWGLDNLLKDKFLWRIDTRCLLVCN